MSARLLLLGLLVAAGASGCGAEPTCVVIEVDWLGYLAPEALDTLHFELSDDQGVFVERSFPLSTDAPPASLALCQGARTPAQLELVVFGLRGSEVVTQSTPREVSFGVDGETFTVELP